MAKSKIQEGFENLMQEDIKASEKLEKGIQLINKSKATKKEKCFELSKQLLKSIGLQSKHISTLDRREKNEEESSRIFYLENAKNLVKRLPYIK